MPKAFAILILVGWPAVCSAQPAEIPEGSSGAGEIYWLPLPVEEIETPDELDDGRVGEFGLYASTAIRDGRADARRVEAAGVRGSRVARASVLGSVERAEAWTVALQSTRSGVQALAGRIAAGAAGLPFAEAVGLARRASRVPMARADLPALAAPTGGSSPAMEGIAMSRSVGAAGMARAGGWIVAGRRAGDGARIAAAGIAVPARWGAWGVAAGALDGRQVAGASISAHGPSAAIGANASVGPRGPAALFSIESGRDGVVVRGRWRYRAGDARPVACEIVAETGTRRARCRFRAIEGPSGAAGSVGRVEVEGTVAPGFAGPATLRVGHSRTEGFSTEEGATLRRERYAVLETTVARSGARRLTMLATRRERESPEGGRTGSSLGATLDVAWRRRGALRLSVEATRVDAEGGAAWGNSWYAGGAASLTSRSRPGVSAAARGTVRLGRWNLGSLLQAREETAGRRATAATIWIQRALPAAAR